MDWLLNRVEMGSWNSTLFGIAILSLLMFLGSMIAAAVLIVRMPADHFTRDRRKENERRAKHPLVAGLGRLITNALGVLMLACGLIMLLTPGQGILFLFLGVTLVDFPGKQNLVRRMLGHRRVLPMINHIRDKAGRLPLEMPPG